MKRESGETLYDFIGRLRQAELDVVEATSLMRKYASDAEIVDLLRAAHRDDPDVLMSFVLSRLPHDSGEIVVSAVCQIIEHDKDWSAVEDAIEFLGDARNPLATPTLTNFLLWPRPADFNGYTGEKAVDALAKLGGARANAAVRFATHSTRRRVWQATISHVIERRDDSLLRFLAGRLLAEDPWSFYVERVLEPLAEMDAASAWRLIEDFANCEDTENRELAAAFLLKGRLS